MNANSFSSMKKLNTWDCLVCHARDKFRCRSKLGLIKSIHNNSSLFLTSSHDGDICRCNTRLSLLIENSDIYINLYNLPFTSSECWRVFVLGLCVCPYVLRVSLGVPIGRAGQFGVIYSNLGRKTRRAGLL